MLPSLEYSALLSTISRKLKSEFQLPIEPYTAISKEGEDEGSGVKPHSAGRAARVFEHACT